jgi:hypothetical protein
MANKVSRRHTSLPYSRSSRYYIHIPINGLQSGRMQTKRFGSTTRPSRTCTFVWTNQSRRCFHPSLGAITLGATSAVSLPDSKVGAMKRVISNARPGSPMPFSSPVNPKRWRNVSSFSVPPASICGAQRAYLFSPRKRSVAIDRVNRDQSRQSRSISISDQVIDLHLHR